MVSKKLQVRSKKYSILFTLFLTSYFSLLTSHFIQKANADTISNDNYSIDVGNIDTNPQPTSHPQALITNNIKTNEFTTGPNYTIDTSNDSFSIKLSQDTIDYGILTSTNPVIRTSKISFSNTTFRAEILTHEDHPLLLTPK